MRIVGWVLLILGVVLSLALVLAGIGSGSGFEAIRGAIYGGFLAMFGWRLTKYGKGLRGSAGGISPSAPATGSAAQMSGSGAAVATALATESVPLTPEAHGKLIRYRKSVRRLYGLIIAGGAVLFPVIFIFAGWDDIKKGDWSLVLYLALPIIAGFTLLMGIIYYFTRERPLRQDLRDAAYLRTSGAIQLVGISANSYLLRLEDRAFTVYQNDAQKALRGVDWATVEYSQHAHFIFAARDQSNQPIYSA